MSVQETLNPASTIRIEDVKPGMRLAWLRRNTRGDVKRMEMSAGFAASKGAKARRGTAAPYAEVIDVHFDNSHALQGLWPSQVIKKYAANLMTMRRGSLVEVVETYSKLGA